MGNLLGSSDKWSGKDQPRHQSLQRYESEHEMNNAKKQKECKEAADHKTYFVCQGLGKSCGYRMWKCLNKQVTLEEANEWIKQQVATKEAARGTPRRHWETPYHYQLIQTKNLNELAYALGQYPYMVNEQDEEDLSNYDPESNLR